MAGRAAIVTLVLGERHRRLWQRHARPGWQRYAERHGLDLIALDAPLDSSPRAAARSPAWQKLLVASQPFARDYERLVWLDADVLIHPEAPSILAGVPEECVGGVDEFSQPDPDAYRHALRTLYRIFEGEGVPVHRNETPAEFYAAFGLADGGPRVVNTGVLVLTPARHGALLEDVYRRYEELPGAHMLAEMRPLSWELCRAGVMHWLDGRFNRLWAVEKALRFPFLLRGGRHPAAARCARIALSDSHFLHFAGLHAEMALLEEGGEPLPPPRPRRAPSVPAPRAPRCDTPVALLLYNRPETTARVLAAIRAVRPSRLLLIADGPRREVEGDAARCVAARAEAERIDWDCAIERDYAEVNQGLAARVAGGLDWLFERVDEAIVLEDDCLPHPSFFRFCGELLQRHRGDERVMSIAGSDFRFGLVPSDASYAASRYPLVWGWATWARAWRRHDPSMADWPELLRRGWVRQHVTGRAADYWEYVFNDAYERRHTWDFAWTLSCWRANAVALHPNVNLVSNIGFGAGASHTHDSRDAFAEMPVEAMSFPLRHPDTLEPDPRGEELIDQNLFGGSVDRLWQRLRLRRSRIQD